MRFVRVVVVCAGALVASAGLLRDPAPRLAAAQPAPSAQALQVEKITDRLFVLHGAGGNTAAWITANGVVVVDTKLPRWGQPIIDRLREITDRPVTTVVNTHAHFDHTNGNIEFPPEVEFVAHEETARLMLAPRPVLGLLSSSPRDIFDEHDGHGLPERTFKDRLTLGTGDDRVELYYFGRAHTSGDAWVVFPAARAVHVGDVFPGKTVPVIDGNNGGSGIEYLQTLDRVLASLKDIDVVITGHWHTALTVADLRTFREFMGEFVAGVQAAKSAGRSIDDVAGTWRIPRRFVQMGYTHPGLRVRANVEVIWKETK
ncbi:MAG TPA: MBL fold metallo-hydrolase [Vicinamibacterales bacterium]|nr:MBL fold metallo-hydrolase [Vicinamibacterales bacterium]